MLGFGDLAGSQTMKPIEIALTAVGAVLSLSLGLMRGQADKLSTRDGVRFVQWGKASLALFASNIVAKLVLDLVGVATGGNASAVGKSLVFTLGLTLLGEALVLWIRTEARQESAAAVSRGACAHRDRTPREPPSAAPASATRTSTTMAGGSTASVPRSRPPTSPSGYRTFGGGGGRRVDAEASDGGTMSRMSTHVSDPGGQESTPTVTVRGEAVLRAEPDEALLWITLTALENDPGRALADVSRRSAQLATMLDELGVASADRSTTGGHRLRGVRPHPQRPPIARPPSRREHVRTPDRL